MANQSAKKNDIKNVSRIKWVTYASSLLVVWYLLMEFLGGTLFEVKPFLVSSLVLVSTYFCCKQLFKSWDLQLPVEAYEYYMDILALNLIVMLFSPLTSYVWYVYLLIPGYLLLIIGKWLWRYITPEYVPEEETEEGKKKGKEKEKKQKVKYIKG